MRGATYRLHIAGEPTGTRANMTPQEADETNAMLTDHGYEWVFEDKANRHTPFTLSHLDGTRQDFTGHTHFNRWLDTGGMDAMRRSASAHIHAETQPVRRAA